MTKTIILVTGGTGGHIFPAQAVAEELSSQGFKILIFGDKNYSKYHKNNSSYKFKIIHSSKLSKNLFSLIKVTIKIGFGILQSMFWIIKNNPKIIVAFGGYSTFPTLISAIILRKKIILHEQNAHFGKVNRIFAKFANKIALSYKKTDGINDEFLSKTILTGNPIRQEIVALSDDEYQIPNFYPKTKEVDNLGYDVLLASEFSNKKNLQNKPTFNILVLGGSGGAKIFSQILPEAFFNLRDEIKNHLRITQQCRADDIENLSKKYQNFNLNITINSFFKDIDKKIKDAHLVIARSGSSSLAEFTCAKKPMILIPFALAADNHQAKNAQFLEEAEAAIVIREEDFIINNVTNIIEKLVDNPSLLIKMSRNSSKCANLDAVEKLATLIAM